MPLAGVAAARGGRLASGARPGAFGAVTGSSGGKPFNHLPQIIAAFPGVLNDIIAETTDDLAILASNLAPVQSDPRPGDPAPGTLKASAVVKLYRARATDVVITGRVSFQAKDRRGHRYARPVESGSHRKRGKGRGGHSASGLRAESYVPPEPFLVPAIQEMRPVFVERLQGLESRLPR